MINVSVGAATKVLAEAEGLKSFEYSVAAPMPPLPLGLQRLWFREVGDFAAVRAAEAWCEARGISVGYMQAHSPRGLLIGSGAIAKWRNLSDEERAGLDGTMTGDFRCGPVMVELRASAVASIEATGSTS